MCLKLFGSPIVSLVLLMDLLKAVVSEVKCILTTVDFLNCPNNQFSVNRASYYVKSAAVVHFPFAVAAPKATKSPMCKALRLSMCVGPLVACL